MKPFAIIRKKRSQNDHYDQYNQVDSWALVCTNKHQLDTAIDYVICMF